MWNVLKSIKQFLKIFKCLLYNKLSLLELARLKLYCLKLSYLELSCIKLFCLVVESLWVVMKCFYLPLRWPSQLPLWWPSHLPKLAALSAALSTALLPASPAASLARCRLPLMLSWYSCPNFYWTPSPLKFGSKNRNWIFN